MEKKQNEKSTNNSLKTKRDIKDVIIGLFFIVFGCFFFVIMTVWMILSKIYTFTEEELESMSSISRFIIKDKNYSFVIVIFLPVIIIVFYCRRMAYNYFIHNF